MERFSICLYGLGGQGLKSMIQDILAPIILQADLEVQSLPFFGGERRGALVSGYLRCGSERISTHSFITDPDMIVIFDHQRVSITNVLKGLKPGAIILINTAFPNQFLELTKNWQVYTLNARAISLACEIGNPKDPYMVINSAMAGAMLKILELVFENQFSDDSVKAVLDKALPQKILENILALREGKKTVIKLISNGTPTQQQLTTNKSIPYIMQPDERCTKCNLCYLFCPKRAIEVAANNVYIIHEEECNYCGICVNLCPLNAITIITKEGDVSYE